MRIYKQRINYWSCSKFANWLRGKKKPHALTEEDWQDWNKKVKQEHPIRFFLAEKCLNKIQNFIMFPCDLYKTIKINLLNRFVYQYHMLKTGLNPYGYYDFDHRIINALFNELKDYVEIELGHSWIYWHKEFKLKKGRSKEAGMAHLNWQIGLTYEFDEEKKDLSTPQAEAAKIVLELYQWWENRKYRPDPMDESGWLNSYDKKDKIEKNIASKKLQEIEDNYEKEDDEMLMKLIKIRTSVWT